MVELGIRKIYLTLLMAVVMAVVSCSRNTGAMDCLKVLGECSELGTVEYTCAMKFKNTPTKYEGIKPGPRVILYSADAYLKAGVKLDDISKVRVDVSLDGRSVTVTLPQPVILEYRLEPKDVEKEFEKVGFFRWRFTAEEKLAIRKKAEEELLAQVEGDNPRIGILAEARSNASSELTLLLKATGKYDFVAVNFAGDEEAL